VSAVVVQKTKTNSLQRQQ